MVERAAPARAGWVLLCLGFAGCGAGGSDEGDGECNPFGEIECPSEQEPEPNSPEVECDTGTEAPSSLLDTCFARIQAGELAPNLRKYEPRFESYIDGARSRRWIYMPPGQSVDVSEIDRWQFPEGTMIWQEIVATARVETRVLQKTGSGIGESAWRASTYVWTVEQDDAHLTSDGTGPRSDREYVVDTLPTHNVATQDSCRDCHSASADMVLGFSAFQLSDLSRSGSIDVWSEGGYLSEVQEPVEMVGTALDQDVLGYLHTNCGTCHSPDGSAGLTGMDLSYSVAESDSLATTNVFRTAVYNDLRILPGSAGYSTIYSNVNTRAMPPDEFSEVRDNDFRSLLINWINGLEPVASVIDPSLPRTLLADTDGLGALGYQETQEDSERGRVFVRREPLTIRSRITTPIDTTKTYRISGRFKSDAATLSRLYFGVAPYTEEMRLIRAYDANRTGTALAVDPANTTATSILVDGIIGDWYAPPQPGYRRAIGFYFDGDTSHLPDFVLYNSRDHYSEEPTAGAYGLPNGDTLNLNIPIPDDVLAAITSDTVIMNHYSGGTYHYTAASYVEVGPEWTELSGVISGESFTPGNNIFRPQTRYVKILLLLNHGQSGLGSRILFDDLKIEEVVEPPPPDDPPVPVE